MNTTSLLPGVATVSLSLMELRAINNALNEACNGLDIPEFATRMGVERGEAATLLQQVHALIDRMEQL